MRNPRIAVASIVALVAFAAAGTARAQVVGVDGVGEPHKVFESPQHFALEARFGAFSPAIDSDPALAGTPYAESFGSCSKTGCSASPQLLGGAEFSWQALRIPHVGTLGPGLAGSYMRASGKAKFAGMPHNGQTTSGEDTSLEIFPFYGVAVLRVDVLWRELGIPLVPWAKLGMGLAFWHATNTLGTSSYQGIAGQGHSLGTHVALGLGLNLNAFDTTAAREFDNTMGVNGTYVFAEWMREDLGLQSGAMRVGGTEWTFGLALEF